MTTALITGASRGIGAATALQLARQGVHVAINYRDKAARADRVVFVTSHEAHFFGDQPTLPEYEPVAASKNAGERALLERRQRYADRGIGLTVVSGDLIDGTITAKLLDRARPGLVDERRAAAGYLPTVDEFAARVAAATLAAEPAEIIFVGELR